MRYPPGRPLRKIPRPRSSSESSHHPTALQESERPSWLVIPEAGLYTGVLIVDAVGSGKTSACMYPFARQILSWQANRPGRRASALVLEVKGDFCHGVRRILEEAGRGEDYIEIGLDGAWQWNPLDDPLLDTYSLAYSISTLINQLFGKSREPFWQQAYTNIVRWIIELHRLLPGRWVTLQDVYRCTINAELFAGKIQEAKDLAAKASPEEVVISRRALIAAAGALGEWRWREQPGEEEARCPLDPGLREQLTELGIPFGVEHGGVEAGRELREQVEAIERWYLHDWMVLDTKLRTSIVEGISVFLSLFDQPKVARAFCPPPPGPQPPLDAGTGPRDGGETAAAAQRLPGLRRRLPPLAEVIESGKVLALNMPAGANPALGRAIGVLLKNAWMQALLRRPAEAARMPGRYLRPATFICDEYQAFATVGQDDPGGDEKAFALTRQCRLIPVIATQSISSLRSVLPGAEAWRTPRPDAPDPDLPLPLRRVVGADGLGYVRERHEDRALLHLHRDDRAARVLPPLGTGGGRTGDGRSGRASRSGSPGNRCSRPGRSPSSTTARPCASPTTERARSRPGAST